MGKRKFNARHAEHGNYVMLTTGELLKMWLARVLKLQEKESVIDAKVEIIRARANPVNVEVHHLAIVLDGKVEEVMRADSRLSALLLSEPKFVEFDPKVNPLTIGQEYKNEA
jgi:hypothetical protein